MMDRVFDTVLRAWRLIGKIPIIAILSAVEWCDLYEASYIGIDTKHCPCRYRKASNSGAIARHGTPGTPQVKHLPVHNLY